MRQLYDTIIRFVKVLDQVIHTFGRGREAFFQGIELTAKFDDEIIRLFFFCSAPGGIIIITIQIYKKKKLLISELVDSQTKLRQTYKD